MDTGIPDTDPVRFQKSIGFKALVSAVVTVRVDGEQSKSGWKIEDLLSIVLLSFSLLSVQWTEAILASPNAFIHRLHVRSCVSSINPMSELDTSLPNASRTLQRLRICPLCSLWLRSLRYDIVSLYFISFDSSIILVLSSKRGRA